ncbi:MAG: efflux RND transporter periplasmic adaptor subunit [Magnetococcales bacterium]|nr:efflux RND transporter periplasmic adaptor subunit [Magnetococcales bacterium]
MKMIPRPLLAIGFSLVMGILCTSCSTETGTEKKKPDDPPVPVSTATVVKKNVPRIIHALGHAESCRTVAIKAQVDGEIVTSHIADGVAVEINDPLFDLDDRRYRLRLDQLRANLEKDLAQLDLARSRERRQSLLNKEHISSEENLATVAANRRVLEATVLADRAAIAEGELQLGFTRIRSPLSGQTGQVLIHPGNLVKANDTTPLVVIHQIDPICIALTVAERHFAEIRQNHARKPLMMAVFPDGQTGVSLPATLKSIDNAIDRQTGSLRLEAEGANGERLLWPGMYVTLDLTLADRPESLVIPAKAIQTGSDGPFVYIVKGDQTVDLRPIRLVEEDKAEAVVATGLAAGETVVTVGQWRLKPGAKVEVAGKKDEKP